MQTERDEGWFEALYRAHLQPVRKYVVRRAGLEHADDIVAEVFTTAWRRRDDIPERVLPWLYGVAANQIAHAARTRGRAERVVAKLADQPMMATGAPEHAELDALFAELSASDAELLRLAYWEQLEAAEIAAVLGCTPGAARVRLHRARRRAERIIADPDQITPTSQEVLQ